MKRVRIHAGMVGLVFKNGNYTRVITEGKHWINFREQVAKYSLSQPFNAPRALEILLKDQALAALLTVIEVKDNEIVLVYENGNFKQVLTAGRYTYWNSLIDYKFVTADLSKIEITEDIEKSVAACGGMGLPGNLDHGLWVPNLNLPRGRQLQSRT